MARTSRSLIPLLLTVIAGGCAPTPEPAPGPPAPEVVWTGDGVEATVEIWFFISEQGMVEDTRISRTSGRAQFDDAALRVADVFRFTPALNRGDPAAVWIQVPITFQVR